jgi:hypothetical protein
MIHPDPRLGFAGKRCRQIRAHQNFYNIYNSCMFEFNVIRVGSVTDALSRMACGCVRHA